MSDFRNAWRTLRTMPVLSAIVVLSLGIGIGVNTAVFSWVQLLTIKPMPGVEDASSFYHVEPRSDAGSYPGVSWLEYQDLRQRLRSFDGLMASRMVTLNVGEASRTERAVGQLVSGNYFSTLGITPAAGRFLRPDEVMKPGAEAVVVISYDYAQTRFGAAANALGQRLRANNIDLAIIGVTPEGFQGGVLGLQFDLWVPATLAPALLIGSRELEDRNVRGYGVLGKLANDASVQQAQTELDAAMRDLARTYPGSNATIAGEVLPFWRAPRGPQRMFLQSLLVLQGVMLLLLLAVCGNTANLLLARATSRTREVGVRLAIGAKPWRIARLLIAENLLLGGAGALLGVVIAMWGTQAFRAGSFQALGFPIKLQTSVDLTGLVVAIVLGLSCALAIGLAPALHLARLDPHRALGASNRTAPRQGLRNGLMALQVGLALAVLVAAGLFYRSFFETRALDPGFRREGVLLAAYDLSGRGLEPDQVRQFSARLLEQLSTISGVDVAAISTSVPLDIHGLPLAAFTLEGRARTDGAPDRALRNTVTPGYFQALDIPLLAGRDFVSLDDRDAPAQVIVNDEFVRRFVPNGEAIGRRLESGSRTYVVAGVVRNSMLESFGEQPIPSMYFSYRDRPGYSGEIHLRTRAGSETSLAPDLRRVVQQLNASLPIYNVRTMTDHVETNLFLRRIPARMFVVLGPLLLLLAAIGIYGVVAYTVAHRTSEIGVRIALGATRSRVILQIMRESMRVVGAGAVGGWLAVFGVYIHLVRPAPIYASTFFGIPLVLLAVAALSCWLPARNATRIDPMVALRRD